MLFSEAYRRGAEFSERAATFRQPLFLLAHQDDELNYAGIISRLGPKTIFSWVTNGDGLYYESDLTPEKYGDLRMAEAVRAVGAVGIPEPNCRFMKFSEVEIYRRMSQLYSGAPIAGHKGYFDGIREQVKKTVFDTKPDIIFTCAWQGGHPEHDLTHFFTMLAIREYEKETGERIEFFELPEYEYTILLPMRFHPLYKGSRFRIRLTPAELEAKRRLIDAYPSQKRLFSEFEKVFTYIGKLGYLTGGPKNADEFLSIEEFSPVPKNNYARKPHLFDYFTYMFDDFEGTPVTYSGSIRPIVRAYLG